MKIIKCAICATKLKRNILRELDGVQFKDGALCWNCFKQAGMKKSGYVCRSDPVSTAIKGIEEEKKKKELAIEAAELARINTKKEIEFRTGIFQHFGTITFYPNQGRLSIRDKDLLLDYNIQNILAFEVLENGYSLTKGGLGMAAAGGLLFGGAGAIVGAVVGGKKSKQVISSLQLKLILRDPMHPIRYINFIESNTKKDSSLYKGAIARIYEAAATIKVMIEEHERVIVKAEEDRDEKAEQGWKNQVADELLKLKSLLDQKVITKEEFAKQKKKLLQ